MRNKIKKAEYGAIVNNSGRSQVTSYGNDFERSNRDYLNNRFRFNFTNPLASQSTLFNQRIDTEKTDTNNFTNSVNSSNLLKTNLTKEDITPTSSNSSTSNAYIGNLPTSNKSSWKNNLGSFASTSSAANSLISSIPGLAVQDSKSMAVNTGLGLASNVAKNFGPWGMLVAGILDTTAGLNQVFGKTVKGTGDSYFTDRSSSFGGLGKLDTKRYGFINQNGARAYKNRVNKLKNQRLQSEDILYNAYLNNMASSGRAQNLSNYYQLNNEGGLGTIRAGKEGLEFARKVLKKFQDGGKMNVIPDGALHARLHNIDDSSLNGNITKKGIPVIHRDGDKIDQLAEIEKNELILTKEVTDKLEDLRKKNTPESAIEAGKLLVQEILYNTKDNTGLLNSI